MLQVALFLFLCAYAHGLQVNTTEGFVEGALSHDGRYYAFYGIPYAGPTDGQNRFKAPVPAQPYPGPFTANDGNVICAQPTPRGIMGVENCLTVNIFTKNVTAPKPVFVFLNSNEYKNTYTQNMFSPRDILDKETVFVSMNFRLSIFGFLCLGVPEAPGNAGLKDVIHGLKWIKANIANFGGDPNNVILLGHAAGAAMVDLLTLSPQSENLVHKAIALSGSGLAPWAVAYEPIQYAQLLGNKLGYGGKTPADLAKHLVTTDINVIQSELADFKFTNNTPLFAPCIEDPNLNGSLITDAPINVLRSGNYRHIPFIYGYTSKEGTFRVAEGIENWLQLMQENFTNFLQADLKFKDNTTAEAANIRNFYFSNSEINIATVDDYLDYQGDTLVLVSTIRTAIERASTTTSEVRLVELGYMGTSNSDWIYHQVTLNGAKHGDFLNYLFDFDIRAVDQPVRASIVNRITGFAYNWNTLRNVAAWPPITRNITTHLYYGGNGTPTTNNNSAIHVEEYKVTLHPQRMTFWNNLYDKYYVAPTSVNSSNVAIAGVVFVMLCQFIVRLF